MPYGSTPRSNRADASERRFGAGDGLTDPDEGEPGHLEHDGRRGVTDLGVQTAHDAAEPDGRVAGVANEEVVAGEGAVLSIERGEVLTVAGETDSEPSPAERLEVVGVVRLVEFQHHVVADVDDVADRTHAGGGESPRHPSPPRA